MGYCTQVDMVNRFGAEELIQLTDRTNAGVIDTTVLDAAIADASAEMDGYLGGRYTLPLITVPVVLSRLCADMVRYYLYDDVPLDQVRQRYEDAIAFLRRVASGQVTLGLATDGKAATPSDGAEMQSGGRVFSRDDTGFI